MLASDRRGKGKSDELDAVRILGGARIAPRRRMPRELSSERARVATRVLVVAREQVALCPPLTRYGPLTAGSPRFYAAEAKRGSGGSCATTPQRAAQGPVERSGGNPGRRRRDRTSQIMPLCETMDWGVIDAQCV
jgi:hypothetical protein